MNEQIVAQEIIELQEAADFHRRRANKLAGEVRDLTRLLELLIPRGSEFSGSPEACAAWVRERLAGVGKLALQRNRYRQAAETLAEALEFYAHPPQEAEQAADYYVADGGHRAREALARWQEVNRGN